LKKKNKELRFQNSSFEEILWEKNLNIDTRGRDESKADEHHQPYQPTYYEVLDIIVKSGYIDSSSVVVDYGCGKGRVLFYLYYKLGCRCIGIEYESVFYEGALKNKESFFKGRKYDDSGITFINGAAEKYNPPVDANTFFFFNPFSLEIHKAVLNKIRNSYFEKEREITLVFYYVLEDTEAYLTGISDIELVDNIDCVEVLKKRDQRHKILIYKMK